MNTGGANSSINTHTKLFITAKPKLNISHTDGYFLESAKYRLHRDDVWHRFHWQINGVCLSPLPEFSRFDAVLKNLSKLYVGNTSSPFAENPESVPGLTFTQRVNFARTVT